MRQKKAVPAVYALFIHTLMWDKLNSRLAADVQTKVDCFKNLSV